MHGPAPGTLAIEFQGNEASLQVLSVCGGEGGTNADAQDTKEVSDQMSDNEIEDSYDQSHDGIVVASTPKRRRSRGWV